MAAPATRPRLFTLPRVIMSLLLAVAFAGMYVAFTLHDDTSNPRLRPQAVRSVSPEPDSLQLRQTEIFAELEPLFSATLMVNDVVIPDDQLQVIEGLNRYSFTPGEGQEIEQLPAGRNCAVIRYQRVGDDASLPASFRWCFNIA
ncbi:MAG: hypothetical protein ABIW46_03745 [Acidimicrobiales bacterium]